jgi:hypothetical protein
LQLRDAGIHRQQHQPNRFRPQLGQTVRLRLAERAIEQRRQQCVELSWLGGVSQRT